MRTITDSTGVQWTVFEVKGPGGSRDRMSYLPEEFGGGWLCFESDISKRRLTPVPPLWRDFSDGELERLLGQAIPAARSKLGAEDRRSDRA